MAIEKLYDEVMMDHIKNARNYRVIPNAQRKAAAINRLCGDEITVYLSLRSEQIDDVAFRCSSCGISMASASMMTDAVKGKSCAEARDLARSVQARIEATESENSSPLNSELQTIVAALRQFPARKTCVKLAWVALTLALEGEEETISVS